jgi:hypothetical protein
MDAITETTSTEDVVIDTDATETETPGFGKELTKTLAVSTATSAGVFGGFVVIALLTPKVKNWWANRKSNVVEGEVAETSTETGTSEN